MKTHVTPPVALTHETNVTADMREQFPLKARVGPHLDVLLKISAGLTRNGRDAIRLMREALTEAHETWHDPTPNADDDVRLYDILTHRYFNGFQPVTRAAEPHVGENCDERALRYLQNQVCSRDHPDTADVDDRDMKQYLNKAIANMPSMFRSTMILSYLEGFSNAEIAALAGVAPLTIGGLLDRGSSLLQSEFRALLLDNCSFESMELATRIA
jgi:DNA-directed RNA polymerase specialized sigma24 family protein